MKYFTPTKLSENMNETPEGFLVCLGVPIARTGWQDYAAGEIPLEAGDDGLIHVYRDAEEVFHPDTMASFEGKAFTINHPKDDVDPLNWKDLAKGVLQNVRKSTGKDEDGEQSLLSDVLVMDVLAIQLIKAGLREVSCGYDAIYEQTGDGKGRQTQIIGNHLALVKEGRAGPGYAIHDHKTERLSGMSKFAEKVKSLFSKAIDEAAAEAEKTKDAMPEDKEKKDDKKTGDDEGKVEKKADGSTAYDDIKAMVKDLAEKIEGMGKKGKDEEKPMEEKKDDKKSGDADPEVSVEERLKKIEAFIAKLMEKESTGDVDPEKKKDEEESVGDDDGDEDDDDSSATGDTASRAEILSPGIGITKDVKVKSLKAAYATKDGKAVIDSLTGGKAPAFDSEEHVSNLFIAASEIMKAKRGTGLEGTKNSKSFDSGMGNTANDMTAEKMNEINKAFYGQK